MARIRILHGIIVAFAPENVREMEIISQEMKTVSPEMNFFLEK
jgi:hypothetical protein